MTVDDVLAKVGSARTLSVQPARGSVHCAVCYKRAVHAVSIYQPRGEVIPLCAAHFGEVKQAIQEAMAKHD